MFNQISPSSGWLGTGENYNSSSDLISRNSWECWKDLNSTLIPHVKHKGLRQGAIIIFQKKKSPNQISNFEFFIFSFFLLKIVCTETKEAEPTNVGAVCTKESIGEHLHHSHHLRHHQHCLLCHHRHHYNRNPHQFDLNNSLRIRQHFLILSILRHRFEKCS